MWQIVETFWERFRYFSLNYDWNSNVSVSHFNQKQFKQYKVSKNPNTHWNSQQNHVWKFYWHSVNEVKFQKSIPGDLLWYSGHKLDTLIILRLWGVLEKCSIHPELLLIHSSESAGLIALILSDLFLRFKQQPSGKHVWYLKFTSLVSHWSYEARACSQQDFCKYPPKST